MIDLEESENSEGGDTNMCNTSATAFYKDEPYTFEDPYFDHEADLDHDAASVENTNALIDQLEEQLAQANADKEALIADVKFLGDQLEDAAGLIELVTLSLLDATESLLRQHDEINASHAAEILANAAVRNGLRRIALLESELKTEKVLSDNETRQVKSLLSENASLKESMRDVEWSTDFWKRQNDNKRQRIHELRNDLEWVTRPFWRKALDFLSSKTKPTYGNILDPKPVA